MPKMRLRLMKLGDCPNGTRFYTKNCQPRTLVTVNKRHETAIYHIGHEFNIKAEKRRVPSKWKVWAVVNFKDLP